MSLPGPLFNSTYKLCKTAARDGVKCQNGQCKKDHSWIDKLPRDKAKALVKHVDSTESLSFVNVNEKFLAELREEIAKE